MRAAVGAVRAERPPALGRALTYRCLVLPRAVSFRAVEPLFSNHEYSLHKVSAPLLPWGRCCAVHPWDVVGVRGLSAGLLRRAPRSRRADGVEIVAFHAITATARGRVDGARTRHRRRGRRVHSATKTGPASSTDRRRPGAGRARSNPPRRAFVAHVARDRFELNEAQSSGV